MDQASELTKMKTQEFLDKLSNLPLDTPKNRIYVERGIQLIEWEGNLSPAEQQRLDAIKLSLANSTKN